MEYPQTERKIVTEKIHGKKLEDPYRWLEELKSDQTQKWLENQHTYTKTKLNEIPQREQSLKRIEELLSIGSFTIPRKRNKKLFFKKRTTEDQPILYVQHLPDGEPEVLIDPNRLSEKKPIAMDWYHVSPSGKLVAYGLSKSGDEWSVLHLIDVETKEKLSERIPRTRHCSLAWLHDESGFYYTRYPLLGTVSKEQENYNRHIYFHKIGENYKNDIKIFGEGRDPTELYDINLLSNEKQLLLSINKYSKNDLFLYSLEDESLTEIIANEDCYAYGDIIDNEIWIMTTKNAPRWALYKVNPENPSFENWELIIPESDQTIVDYLVTEKYLYLTVMKNAYDHLKVYTLDGKFLKKIDLPPYGTIAGLGRNQNHTRLIDNFYISFKSFFHPQNIYKISTKNSSKSIFAEIPPPLNPDNYKVTQKWFTSKDGTKVPLFLAHKKNLKLNGKNPTMLCGYGGFNISIKPPYLRYSRFYWLENNGIIALANLRGGSEFGDKWHKSGMLEKKQNVFDDFIAAAEFLIQENYTSPEHLGINGRSNGGLLTGAALTQKPELFGAVYVGVPLLDMIRYHLFSIARLWIPEYGSAENKEQFHYLLDYSPYHNIRKDESYPPTFLVTATSDSRVVAMHAMKMAAKLQWANKNNNPILLWVEQQAGHGVGKPLKKLAKTENDLYTFLGWHTALISK